MYFIVHLLEPSVHVIIPKNWIHGIDGHWEKFVNKSINRNQTFLCFYSEHGDAVNAQNRPNSHFAPNFELGIDVQFPNDGCYHGKLVWYSEKFEDALPIINRRRRVAPALYNEKRLDEIPIPVTGHQRVANTVLPEKHDDMNGSEEGGLNDDGEIEHNFCNEVPNEIPLEEGHSNESLAEERIEQVIVAAIPNNLADVPTDIFEAIEQDPLEPNQIVTSNGIDAVSQNDVSVGSIGNSTPEFNEMGQLQIDTDDNGSPVNSATISPVHQIETDVGTNVVANPSCDISAAIRTDSENGQTSFDTSTSPASQLDDASGVLVSVNTGSSTADDVGATQSHIENDAYVSAENDDSGMKTEPVLVLHPDTSNDNELEGLLDETDELVDEYDEDITFTISKKTGYAKPFATNTDGLVKHENDIVSGNLAFAETTKGRFYMHGNKQILIPKKVINTLKCWNYQPGKSTSEYDKRTTIALLLVCVSSTDLSTHNISNDTKELIFGFLQTRAKNDTGRLNMMDKYISEYCDRKSGENGSANKA